MCITGKQLLGTIYFTTSGIMSHGLPQTIH